MQQNACPSRARLLCLVTAAGNFSIAVVRHSGTDDYINTCLARLEQDVPCIRSSVCPRSTVLGSKIGTHAVIEPDELCLATLCALSKHCVARVQSNQNAYLQPNRVSVLLSKQRGALHPRYPPTAQSTTIAEVAPAHIGITQLAPNLASARTRPF